MLELAPSGFEELEARELLELVAYTDRDGEQRIRAVFPDAASRPVEQGWEKRWRAFHRPAVAGGLWIGPPWEPPPRELSTIVIDPGRAFGTGAHPTTRLCIELLAGMRSRGSLLDAGCGSGVVAIAAVRLGFNPVIAVDVDPVAIEVAHTNAAANGVELDARVLDVTAGALPCANVTVANIDLSSVRTLLGELRSEAAVTAGYLLADRLASPGWRRVERRALDGWAADLFRRASV